MNIEIVPMPCNWVIQCQAEILHAEKAKYNNKQQRLPGPARPCPVRRRPAQQARVGPERQKVTTSPLQNMGLLGSHLIWQASKLEQP